MEELEGKLEFFQFLKPYQLQHEELATLCEETTKCLEPLKCPAAQEAIDVFEAACKNWELANSELMPCMEHFYNALYYEKYRCAKDYDFLTKDLIKRREAFTYGQSCFQEIAQNECSETVSDYLKSPNYAKAVDVLCVNPNRTSCQSLFYELEGMQCKPMSEDVRSRMKKLSFQTVKRGDPELISLLQLCNYTKECLKTNCVFGEDEFKSLSSDCQLIELADTDFIECIQKLANEKPKNLSWLECFKDHDFSTKDEAAKCALFKEQKGCVKVAMKAFCGDGAVKDFDRDAELLRSTFLCQNA
uniref:T20D4.11-like domain-containing protein n=1 Tax=Caenorhabditis japonica TaxID=281687 RepID=A0A8R1HSJ6_CAEJA